MYSELKIKIRSIEVYVRIEIPHIYCLLSDFNQVRGHVTIFPVEFSLDYKRKMRRRGYTRYRYISLADADVQVDDKHFVWTPFIVIRERV